MDHGAAQILGAGLAARMSRCDLVGDAVTADQAGVIDGEVGGALFEIGDWIAARLHHLGEEFIGLVDRRGRIVHELALHLHPALGEPLDLVAAERANIERLDPLLALAQLGLGLATTARFVHCRDIFRAVF